jgi:hypothetical protein
MVEASPMVNADYFNRCVVASQVQPALPGG